MTRNIFLMFGPPGSGKGTQSDMLSEKIGLPAISTGELLRHEKNMKSRIGKKVAKLMTKGELVPDVLVKKLVKKRLKNKDTEVGAIMDGYPRSKDQLADLLKILKKSDNIHVIQIDTEDKEVKSRITGRRVCDCGESYHIKYKKPKKTGYCDDCGKKLYIRADDKPEVIKKRLTRYHKTVENVLLRFGKKEKTLIRIDGNQSIKKVHQDVLKEVKKIL